MDYTDAMELTEFLSDKPLRKLKHHEILIKPESDENTLYFLKSGYVRVYGLSPQGAEITIHIFESGSLFPLMNALNGVQNRYYHETIGQVEVYTLHKEEVERFLVAHPEALLHITKRILFGLDKMTARLELMSTEKASHRLASALIYFSTHFGTKKGEGYVISPTFTHQEIGALAGLSRETVSREWKKLENLGLVSHKKNTIFLVNIGELKKILL